METSQDVSTFSEVEAASVLSERVHLLVSLDLVHHLVRGNKVLTLDPRFLGVLAPEFCLQVQRCGRHCVRLFLDPRQYGLVGEPAVRYRTHASWLKTRFASGE